MPKMTAAMPEGVTAFVSVAYLIGVMGGLMSVFLVWFLYAGVFYLLSAYFDGSGEVRTLIILVGWGFVPKIFAGIFAGALTFTALQGTTPPQSPEAAERFIQGFQESSAHDFSVALEIVFTVWSAFLWMFAVKHGRHLDIRDAAITVFLPIAGSVAWSLHSLL